MENKWSNRDWKWLFGILIGVLTLITTFWLTDIPGAGNYFSVFANAVSVALAFVAIYIALRQDSESQKLNNETQLLLVRMDEKLTNVNEKVSGLDFGQTTKIVNKHMEEVKEYIANKIDNSDNISKGEIIKLVESKMNDNVKNINTDLIKILQKKNHFSNSINFKDYMKKRNNHSNHVNPSKDISNIDVDDQNTGSK
jgi:hypothetical protein